MKLETERLWLRIPEERDVDGYVEVFDAEVMRFLGSATVTREGVAGGGERVRRHWERHDIGLFSVVRKEDERLLGRVGFLLWHPVRWVNAMREALDRDLAVECGV